MQPALPGTTVLYLLNVRELNGQRTFWIAAAKGFERLKGSVGETAKALIGRWVSKHGRPQRVVRYRGVHRPAEAAMALVSIEEPTEA